MEQAEEDLPTIDHSHVVESAQQSPPTQAEEDLPISEQQLGSIRKLCEHLNKPEPENLISLKFLEARKVIQQLTAEYKEARQKQPAPPANNQQEITAASLRAYIAELKPTAPGGELLTLESLYSSIVHKDYPGDNAILVGERARMKRQLDEINRLRSKPVEATA
jgi:hypothetical protein